MRFSKRRAVSQIIGTLMMVAIVASVGSVLMFQGINAVQSFTTSMATVVVFQTDAARENLLIEHVKMDPATDDVHFYITNIGTVDVVVSTIKMMKIDDQYLIISKNVSELITMQERKEITLDADLSKLLNPTVADCAPNPSPCVDNSWRNPEYSASKEYLISVTTTDGNSFQKGVSPFNT